MEQKELVEWVISKDAREILLIASIIGSVVFLLYGVFNGKPPFLKEASIDEKGRRVSFWLGGVFLGVFFLTLTIPVIYDIFLDDSLELYLDNNPLDSNVSFIAIGQNNKILPGRITVKKAGKINSQPIITLPSSDENLSFYKEPLSILGRRGNKYFPIATGGDDRVYVSDNAGKIWGPIKVEDSDGVEVTNIPTYNWGAIVVPDNSRVEFYNAALLYRDEQGVLQKRWIGSKLDFEKWDYGKDEEVLREWEEPRTINVLMIADRYEGRTMSSSIVYNPKRLVASSKVFPIGTELLISNPLIQSTPINVIVQDYSPKGRLVLSSGVFEALQFERRGKPLADVQVVDYHKKRPKQALTKSSSGQ